MFRCIFSTAKPVIANENARQPSTQSCSLQPYKARCLYYLRASIPPQPDSDDCRISRRHAVMAFSKSSRPLICMFLTLFLLCNLFAPANASAAKFTTWFPLLSKGTYESTSSQQCNVTLTQYYESLKGLNRTDHAATCSVQQRCLLEELREDIKSRMSSASVLLGLTPGLLASIGPSFAETAVLATQAPLLALLISLSCPAVYPSRVFEYDDARELLKRPPFTPKTGNSQRSPALSLLITITKYLSLVVAIFNVFYTSWELGTNTVVSWRCINYTFLLTWSVIAVTVHMFAAAAFYTRHRHFWPTTGSSSPVGQFALRRADSNLDERLQPTNRSIVLQHIASFVAFMHIVFGIMIFSSLLFIETVDVVVVVLRYMASVLVSRTILMFELDHIRRQRSAQRGRIGQPREIEFRPIRTPETPGSGYFTITRKPVPTAQISEGTWML